MTLLILGQTLAFEADPFAVPPEESARHASRGGVLVEDGKIAALGSADDLRAAHPQARVADMGDALISAGFVDCHAHYPQTGIIASWGRRLIDWLNGYTFPEELRFGDPAYARAQAELYLDLTLSNGTTTPCAFATVRRPGGGGAKDGGSAGVVDGGGGGARSTGRGVRSDRH